MENTFALSTKDVRDAALAPPVDMNMSASNDNAWQPTRDGSTSQLLFKTPILNPHSHTELSAIGTLTLGLAGGSSNIETIQQV